MYEVDIYVSADNNLSQSDVNFFSDNCIRTDGCERTNSDLECQYDGTTANTIRCGLEINRSSGGTNVSNVVRDNVFTQGAYIIIQTCNITNLSCGTSSHAVFFE